MNWTPTDITPIAIAAITAASGICIALLTKKKGKAKDTAPVIELPRPHAPQATTVPETPVLHVVKEVAKAKPTPPTKQELTVVDVSPALMVGSLKGALPAHKESIGANYIGLRIRWAMKLYSVRRIDSNSVNFSGTVEPEGVYLDCDAKREDALCLINVPDKGDVIVEGTLKSVSAAYCELIDCVASQTNVK